MRRRVLSTLVVTAALTSAVALTVRDSWADPVPSASSSAVATPAPVADTSLPAGWRIDGNGGATLTWRSDQDIPVGDAFIEFRSGEHLLGIAEEGDDLRTFRLRLTAGGSLTDLQVWAAGRRLDRGAPAAAQRSSSSLSQPARGTGDGAAAVPVNAVDPGVKGPYATRSGEYSLPDVALRGLRNKVEVRAAVVGPVGAPGRRPVVVLLHGRHFTCYQGTDPASARLDWPCPPGDQEVPSYRGFAQAQELLASQGYLTVSISANGISEQDRQTLDGGAAVRSALIRLHLGKLADWSGSQRSQAPAIIRRLPLADLSKVLLVGHSRGGDGANTAAIDTVNPPPAAVDAYPGKVRWQVRGTVLIGPTSTGQNPAPDVPSLILLPGCDGDVSDLEGQMFADASRGVSTGAALHSAVFMTGANHNFFNSQWTPGLAQAPAFDDASSTDDAVCGTGPTSTRITATQQRAAGATYLAAAARLFIGGDDRVRPLLDGSGTRAPSAGPNPFPTAAVGGARTPFVLPALSLKVTGKAVLCEQTGADEAKACLDQTSVGGSPHFTNLGYAGAGDEPDRYSVRLTASKDGSAAALRPAKPVSLAGSTDLALRIAAPPNSSGNVVAVSVVDKAGKRAKLGEVRLDGLPGTALTSSYWGQERRVSLAAARTAGVDLTAVAGLELVVRGTAGPLFLIDGWDGGPACPRRRPGRSPASTSARSPSPRATPAAGPSPSR